MTLSLQTFWNKALLALFAALCVLFIAGIATPQKAHAAAVSLSTLTATSTNASTTMAKVNDTVNFNLTLSATPWEAPKIWIFNMGTSSFTGANGNWVYSTTSASSWTEGYISYFVSFGSTTAAGPGTTTLSQSSMTGPNVYFDKTAPTGYTASFDSAYVNRAASTSASFTFAGAQTTSGTTYLAYIGNGSATTSAITGSITSATQQISSINLSALSDGNLSLEVSLADGAGNRGTPTTTAASILDTTIPSAPTSTPDAGSYSSSQSVTLQATGSNSIRYNTGSGTPSDPTCSTGTLYSGAFDVEFTQTVKSIACDTAGNTSGVATANFTIAGTGGHSGSHSSSGGGGGGGGSSKPSTPSTPAPSTGSSGLSGAQVSSILSLLTSFGADASIIAKVQMSLGAGGTPTSLPPVFTRDLTLGSSGSDVMQLQKFLNSHGFMVAASGAGSPGMETTLFGGLTKAALAKFQAAHGITPAVGYLGPKTRATIANN